MAPSPSRRGGRRSRRRGWRWRATGTINNIIRRVGGPMAASIQSVRRVVLLVTLALLAASGCASGQQTSGRGQSGAEQAQTGQPRAQTVLRLVTRFEIQSLAAKFDEPGGGAGPYAKRPFNAGLAVIDANTQARPVL